MSQIDSLSRTIAFLESIALPVRIAPGANGFVPNVRIARGTLEVDPAAFASNVLHEAGHIATTPGRYRALLDGNLYAGQRAMLVDVQTMDLEPDDPIYRAAINSTDPEVTAWAWAAGKAIGLSHEEIIRDEEYDGTGANIRMMLSMRAYCGINGLQHGGMCFLRPYNGRPVYPALTQWLQIY